jgi:hypothetical protein
MVKLTANERKQLTRAINRVKFFNIFRYVKNNVIFHTANDEEYEVNHKVLIKR